MSEPTDYVLTPLQASYLSRCSKSSPEERKRLLEDYRATHGTEQLVDLFTQFVGMANSVVENCRQMTDLVLITECGVHPDRFDSLNLPTIIGACQGIELAAGCDPAGACDGCAYRLGSIANQSPMATSDAAFMAFNQKGFMCHAETDDRDNPVRVCVGHAKAFKQRSESHEVTPV